jgi:Putative rhamnosyl transferase
MLRRNVNREARSVEFTHIVLTRFNVVTSFAPSTRGLEEGWLRDRVALFMRYCFPSMTNQRDAQFHWLVFCNADSPTWFKEHMESLAKFLTPIYIEGLATDEVIARKVKEGGYVTTPYLITTRMDNDDALSRDHLATVQRAFKRQEWEFVLFPFGLQLFRGHLYGICWLDNPFFSLIEKVGKSGDVSTVLCCRHGDIYKTGPVLRVWRTPQWLEVIHGKNVSNSLRGWPKLFSRLHREFPSLPTEGVSKDTFIERIVFASQRGRRRLRRLLGSNSSWPAPKLTGED